MGPAGLSESQAASPLTMKKPCLGEIVGLVPRKEEKLTHSPD
jgi:hypothetical protein